MPKWVVHILAPLVCGVALLLGIVALNAVLRGHFHDAQRATVAFGDIECEPPGKLTREEFLGEVQYLANWPDDINLLDQGLPARLHVSFALHPWVEKVERVRITPPRQVRVLLRYRAAVLVVVQPGERKPEERVVDGVGVLLPLAANDPALARLTGKVAAPTGHTGQPWGDPAITYVAGVAGLLAPYQDTLKLTRFEIVNRSLILANERTRIVWGPAANDETPPATRMQALLEQQRQLGSLEGWKIDLHQPERPSVSAYRQP